MPYWKDLTGRVFGKLTVLSMAGRTKANAVTWNAHCECGSTRVVVGGNLTSGITKSCGCSRNGSGVRTHGRSKSRIYYAWASMITRCHNPHAKKYKDYGARGIAVCERWRQSFAAFLEDMGERPTPQHQLDRKNNDGDYEPGNCRWATRAEQMANRRITERFTHAGKTLTLVEWAKETGIEYSTLRQRLHRYGWTVERSLTEGV